jgi:hypothetical protein
MKSRKIAVLTSVVFLAAVMALLVHPVTAKAQGYMFNPVGTWYGNAKPASLPSALPEVVMFPTFLADGNVIANDSIEIVSPPHGTAKGRWVSTGPYSIQATFYWIQLDSKAVNGFGGVWKIRLWGTAKVPNIDSMGGTLSAWYFPPGTDPLDPTDKGGISLGSFVIDQLRRAKAE